MLFSIFLNQIACVVDNSLLENTGLVLETNLLSELEEGYNSGKFLRLRNAFKSDKDDDKKKSKK